MRRETRFEREDDASGGRGVNTKRPWNKNVLLALAAPPTLDRYCVLSCFRPRISLWDADQLFILTAKRAQAVELARIIEEEDWGGEKPIVYDDQEETSGRSTTGLVR